MLESLVQKAVSRLDFTKHMYKKCPWPKNPVKGRDF